MENDYRARAEQGEIAAMLWCAHNLREPEERNCWWVKAIETAHPTSTDFDYFARSYAKWLRWYFEELDVYRENAMGPLHDPVEAWLASRFGLTFAQVRTSLVVNRWEEGRYGDLPTGRLRERLFNNTAYFVLAALADCDLHQRDALQLMKLICEGSFESEVFRADDPTWTKLVEFLVERWTEVD